jgi:hypothetical protein
LNLSLRKLEKSKRIVVKFSGFKFKANLREIIVSFEAKV